MTEFQPVHQRRAARVKTPPPSRRALLSGALCLSTDSTRKTQDDGTVIRRYSMRITIPKWLMERSGILPGTRVEFETAPESRRCLIRPCESGRWTITQNRKIDDKGYLKITFEEGMPTVARTEACHKPKLRSVGIEFAVPDSASFTRNLRADALTQSRLDLEPA